MHRIFRGEHIEKTKPSASHFRCVCHGCSDSGRKNRIAQCQRGAGSMRPIRHTIALSVYCSIHPAEYSAFRQLLPYSAARRKYVPDTPWMRSHSDSSLSGRLSRRRTGNRTGCNRRPSQSGGRTSNACLLQQCRAVLSIRHGWPNSRKACSMLALLGDSHFQRLDNHPSFSCTQRKCDTAKQAVCFHNQGAFFCNRCHSDNLRLGRLISDSDCLFQPVVSVDAS